MSEDTSLMHTESSYSSSSSYNRSKGSAYSRNSSQSPPLPPGAPPSHSNNRNNSKKQSNIRGNHRENRGKNHHYSRPYPPSLPPTRPPLPAASSPLNISFSPLPFSYPVPPSVPHPSLYTQQYVDSSYYSNSIPNFYNQSFTGAPFFSSSSAELSSSYQSSSASTTSSTASLSLNEWKEYMTAEGKIYYSNGVTSVWEMPEEMKEKTSMTLKQDYTTNSSPKTNHDMDNKEAEEHFENLLFSKNISSLAKFREVQDICSNDYRWNYLKSIGEKKQKIAEYQTKKKNIELYRKKQMKQQNIKNFYIMLTEKNFNININWKKNFKLFINDQRFKQIEDDYEREELYNDYIKELYNKKLLNYNSKKENFFYYYINIIKKYFFYNKKFIINDILNDFNVFYTTFSQKINYYNSIDSKYESFSYDSNVECHPDKLNEQELEENHNVYFLFSELKVIYNDMMLLIKFIYQKNKEKKLLLKFNRLKSLYQFNLLHYLSGLVHNNYIKISSKVSDIIYYKNFQESFYYIKLHTIFTDLMDSYSPSQASSYAQTESTFYDYETSTLKLNNIPLELNQIFGVLNQFNEINLDFNKIYSQFKNIFDSNYTINSSGDCILVNKSKENILVDDILFKTPVELQDHFNNEIREICEIVLKKYNETNKVLVKFLDYLNYTITFDSEEEDFITFLILNLKKNKDKFLRTLMHSSLSQSNRNEEEGEEGEENEDVKEKKVKALTLLSSKDVLSYDINFSNYLKHYGLDKVNFLEDIIEEEDEEVKEFYKKFYSSTNFSISSMDSTESLFFNVIDDFFKYSPHILSQYFNNFYDEVKLKYLEEQKIKNKQKKNFLLLIHETFCLNPPTVIESYNEFVSRINKRSAYQLLVDEEAKKNIYSSFIEHFNIENPESIKDLDLKLIQYEGADQDDVENEHEEVIVNIGGEEGEISEDGEIIEEPISKKRHYSESKEKNDEDRMLKK